jgi:glycosyltransferase involved in cell wall biosynthesis
VGQFRYLKGITVGLCAFARALSADPSLSLTLVGKGPEEKRWRDLATQLGIADRVTWISWVPQPEVQKHYLSHGLLLFPSLHDSGGTVLLEALAHGLPIVCLKLGGPGVIVDEHCGRAVLADHGNVERLIREMAQSIREFTGTPEGWAAASARARAAATKWTWSARVDQFGIY